MSGWATDIRGQTDAIRTLEGLRRREGRGRFVLCHGPRGVGKGTAAAAFARALACPQAKVEGQPCGRCAVCRQGPGHPDLPLLVPEADGGSIKVDAVRAESAQAGYPPLVAKARVWIVDPMEALTDGAANALLRLLEEPPTLLWVLGVSHHLHAVPITLRSRAFKVPFRTLPPSDLAALIGSDDPEAVAAGTIERARLVGDRGFRERAAAWEALLDRRLYDPIAAADFDKATASFPGGLAGFWTAWLISGTVAGPGASAYNDADLQRLAPRLAERQVLLSALDDLEAHVNAKFVCEDAVRRIRQIRKEARS